MIELRGVCRTYVSKRGVKCHAVCDVSFSIEEKGMVFVLGRSGCGKTTLLNMIGALDVPDAGDVMFRGRSVHKLSQNEQDSYRAFNTGYVFQSFHLIETFTLKENIALSAQPQGVKNADEKAQALLNAVGLEGYENRFPFEVSGGQCQRAAIARALIKNPDVILADEPTGALDSSTSEDILALLKDLSKERAVVVVSHDRENAYKYADRIIEMKDGRIIRDYKNTAKPYVRKESSRLSEAEFLEVESLLHDGGGVEILTSASPRRIESDIYGRTETQINTPTETQINGQIETEINGQIESEIHGRTETKERIESEINGRTETEINGQIESEINGRTESDINGRTESEIKSTPRAKKEIKTRFSFFHALSFAFECIKARKARLCFTVLLTVVSLATMGFFMFASKFNQGKAVAQTMQNQQARFLPINGQTMSEMLFIPQYFDRIMTIQDLEIFDQQQINTVPVMYAKIKVISASLVNIETANGYRTESTGIADLKRGNATLDIPLNCGQYPSNFDEVAISDYLARMLLRRGYYVNHNDAKTDNLASLIGKTIIFDGSLRAVTIVGVLDFGSEKYTPLLDDLVEFSQMSDERKQLAESFNTEYNTHLGVLFGVEGFCADAYKDVSVGKLLSLHIEHKNQEHAINSYVNVKKYTSDGFRYEKTVIFRDGISDSSQFNDNEIVISSLILSVIGYDVSQIKTKEELQEFCIQNKIFDTVLNVSINTVFGEAETKTAYVSCKIGAVYPEMSAHNIILPKSFNDYLKKNSYSNFLVPIDSHTDVETLVDNILSLSYETGITQTQTAQTQIAQAQIAKNVFMHNTTTSASIIELNAVFVLFSAVFPILFAVLFAFSTLLIYLFFSNSIRHRRNDIGILRSLGATNRGITRAFLIEGAIIALIESVLAIAGTYAVFRVFGNLFTSLYPASKSYSIIRFTPLNGITIVATAFVATFASAILPLLRLRRISPVELVKGKGGENA